MTDGERSIARSLDGLHRKIDRYQQAVIRETALCSICRADVEKHDRILIGDNGHDNGLVSRMARQERFRHRVWGVICMLWTVVSGWALAWYARH